MIRDDRPGASALRYVRVFDESCSRYPATLAIAGMMASAQGAQELAQRRCEEALAAEHGLGTEPSIASLLAGGDPEAAPVLQGAGDAIVPRSAHAHHHVEAREQASATIDASLGAARRHELHAQGATMS